MGSIEGDFLHRSQDTTIISKNASKPESLKESEVFTDQSQHHDLVLRSFGLLIADLCQQFNGGHPGFVPVYVATYTLFNRLT